MRNTMKLSAGVLLLPVMLSGCEPVGTKSMTLSLIYTATMALSFLLLIGYCFAMRKKDIWFLMLFSCVCIVNTGYFCLAVSGNLNEALLANRISYLGSVFLPFAMLMIILNACKLAYRSWLPGLLLAIAAGVFFIAASPGYLDIYYSEVTLEHVDGASVLKKVYGPWHSLYLFYLLAYFSAMIAAVGYASAKKHLYSLVHAFILLCAVFVNIAVWLLEQLSHINFEFLSVSYIITELFLLGVSLLLQEQREVLCADYSADMPEALSASEVSAEPVAESELYIREEKRREEKRREEKRREEKRREEKRREEKNFRTSSFPCDAQPVSDLPAVEPEPIAPLPDEEAGIDPKSDTADELSEQDCYFISQLERLTPTERIIYRYYLAGTGTKDIMQQMNIKENTLKYHNKNIYSKLGVSSRKQLVEIARSLISRGLL